MPAYLVSDLGPDADSDSDTGSHHHPSDDDGAAFVLPSFAYAVPDDVYAPARNRHHLHDQQQQQQQPVRDDSTPADPSTDGNAAHAAHAAHTAYTANADALEKIVHGTDREPTSETQVKAGAAEPAQRVPSSSTTPSSLLIIQPDNQATVTKPKPMPQSKPVPATPALDAYTKLAMQGLCGLSSTSPSPSPPAPRQQQQQQGRTQTPVAPAPLALRVDDPSFLSYQQQKGVPQQYQQAQPPQQQQQQQQATSSPPPWSQPPRALPPHMTDLITTDTMPPQPIVEAGTSPLQDLQSLVAFSEPVQLAPAPAPRTRPSISPLTLSPRSPRPSSPSLVDLFTDLSTSPCPRVPSPPASTTDTQQQQPYAYDELTQGSSLISPQPGDSSEYPSTFSSYQDSAPGSHSSFRSTTSQAPCEPNMLDPNKICFEYLRQLLRKGDSVCVRVEGPKNNQLQWTGDSATSGYFGRQDAFKGLAPDAYQKAVRAVGLDRPNWESQEYLWRSMDAHRWPDQGCVPEDSPWISATTNLEWAIWRTANILTSSSHVYMTFIKPTTERYSLPKPPRSRSKKGQSFQDLHKGNSEVLFYGRIFADSIVARIKWTRTSLPFALPARFWGVPALRDRKMPSWIYYLRWEAKKHPWGKAKALMSGSGSNKLVAWSSQPVERAHAYAWPPGSDEDPTPPSSSVGPPTPEPEPCQLHGTPATAPAPAPTGDLIDLGPIDLFASESSSSNGSLPPPLEPDAKEVNLLGDFLF